jgi:hypothetical protein
MHKGTVKSVDELVNKVAADFNTNYHQQWVDAVKKCSWWWKSKEKIISQLTDLIMEHRMASNILFLNICLVEKLFSCYYYQPDLPN